MVTRKQKQITMYLIDRLTEPSTWQGVGFIVALSGCKLGLGLDWGQATGIGGSISAVIKMCLPDSWKK